MHTTAIWGLESASWRVYLPQQYKRELKLEFQSWKVSLRAFHSSAFLKSHLLLTVIYVPRIVLSSLQALSTGMGCHSLLQGIFPRNLTWVSCIAGRFFTSWATREAHLFLTTTPKSRNYCSSPSLTDEETGAWRSETICLHPKVNTGRAQIWSQADLIWTNV